MCIRDSAESGAAGIGEQIEHLQRTLRTADNAGEPVPVHRLFGKQPCMLEAEGLEAESEFPVMDAPFFREVKKFPFPSALAAAVVIDVYKRQFLTMLISAASRSAVVAVMMPFILIFVPSFLGGIRFPLINKILGPVSYTHLPVKL